ncbi:MAG TPA: Hsp70 family protein, partial [Anaerolineaceae bacterium]|nr:Hsp70 family protein [Anaerolineaceae bacterium]
QKRRELIEARNTADKAIYTTEKTLKDLGDKVSEQHKAAVEDQIATLRRLREEDDAEAINKAIEDLMKTLQEIGQAAYAQEQAQAQQAPQDDGTGQGTSPDDQGDVIDGEFTEAN